MTDSTKYKNYIDLLNDREGLFKYGLLWFCTLPFEVSDYEFSWGFLKKYKTDKLKQIIRERMFDYYNSRYIKLYDSSNYILPTHYHNHQNEDGTTLVYVINPLLTIMEQVYELNPKTADTMAYGLYDTFQNIIKKSDFKEFDRDLIHGANRVIRCFADAGLIETKIDRITTAICDYGIFMNGKCSNFCD